MKRLTENQKRFCNEYLKDLNATRAYKKAYPSVNKDETAASASARLLRNVKVKKYLESRMKEREKRTEITQDKVLKELARIGFADTTDYAQIVLKQSKQIAIDPDGQPFETEITYKAVDLVLTEDLSADQRKVIESIKEGKHGIEVKLHDKVKALELMGRHLGMFNGQTELDAEEQKARIAALKAKAHEDDKEALDKLDSVLEALGGVMNDS